MEVRFFATLRLKTGQASIRIQAGPGDAVRDAIDQVLELYPALAPDVLTKDGELVDHVHVFLNGRKYSPNAGPRFGDPGGPATQHLSSGRWWGTACRRSHERVIKASGVAFLGWFGLGSQCHEMGLGGRHGNPRAAAGRHSHRTCRPSDRYNNSADSGRKAQRSNRRRPVTPDSRSE